MLVDLLPEKLREVINAIVSILSGLGSALRVLCRLQAFGCGAVQSN
jgi:hypothetical protein